MKSWWSFVACLLILPASYCHPVDTQLTSEELSSTEQSPAVDRLRRLLGLESAGEEQDSGFKKPMKRYQSSPYWTDGDRPAVDRSDTLYRRSGGQGQLSDEETEQLLALLQRLLSSSEK